MNTTFTAVGHRARRGARPPRRPGWAAACILALSACVSPVAAARASQRSTASQSSTGKAPAAGKPPSLQDKAAALVSAYEKRDKAVVGAAVTDLRSGRQVVGIRHGELFAPASNQKLLTSAFALLRLGRGFAFTPGVYLLKGKHLVVAGDWDPTLGDPRLAASAGKTIYAELDRWAGAVKAATGGRLAGDIIVLTDGRQESFRHPDWPASQHSRWYAAPVGMGNFNNNCFDVTFRVVDKRPAVVLSPRSRYIAVVNRLRLSGKHLWSLRVAADGSEVTLSGTISQATTDPLSVATDHPPLLLARTLADRLVGAGVKFSGKIYAADSRQVDLGGAAVLAAGRTPLATALARANKRSLNMTAECIFLRAGDGTWRGSAAAMRAGLCEAFGLAGTQLVVRDGSGLSRKNRVAPAAVTRLLAGAAKRDWAGVLLASLPVSGRDGTMASRLARSPYRGRVLAKTGSIGGVRCLSGYVLDAAGRPALALSVLCGGVRSSAAAKALQDDICRLLVDSLAEKRKPAPPGKAAA